MVLDSITSLFIVYRYDSTTGTFTVPSGGDGFYYFSVYFYRYNSSTGTFTVPPSGDGFYYFSVFLAVDAAEICVFDIEINGSQFCSPNSFLSSPPGGEREPTSCSGVAYVAEG